MDAIRPSKNARSPDDDASPPSAQKAEPTSSSSPPDDAAAASHAGGGGAETTRRAEEVDDEQVERFYALLANIRAMRGMFGATTGKRKRPREAEPPWRPAFRMEDFETEEVISDHADAGRCAGRRKLIKRGGDWRLPAAGREKAAVVDDDNGEEAGEVVGRDGPGRDAARGCVDQLASL